MLFKKIPRSILCTTTSEVKRHHRVRLTLAPKSIHSLNERCYLRNAVSSFLLGRTSDTVGGHVNSTRVSAVRRDAQTAAKRLGVHAVRRDTRALQLRGVGRGTHCHRRQSGTSDPSGASTHGTIATNSIQLQHHLYLLKDDNSETFDLPLAVNIQSLERKHQSTVLAQDHV